jgi:serine/threonine protein kinase
VETIGRYQIVHRIAVGGMAEVFLGRVVGEGGFEKVVAIKRILHHLAANEKFIKMFMDEARISATLSHSNIAQIFEFGRAGDVYFIAMEHVGGLSLRSILRHFRKQLGVPPPPGMTAFIAGQICAGLEYAHTCSDAYGQPLNIVHRDVSPSNVLVSFNGEIKLIDFGVAKASHRMQETVGGDLKGKYAYMSPEQASGDAMDHRSDIFAAGIVLLEMLTGKNPFRGETDLATLANVQRANVPLPAATLQGDAIKLYEVAIRALSRVPVKRFASAGDMQEALERYGRRNPYGARQLRRWMQDTFPTERERVQELLRRAAEEDAPTVEIEDVGGTVEPVTDEVLADEGQDLDAPTLEQPAALERRKPRAPTPAPARVEVQVVPEAAPRQDPSKSLTPLTPTGPSAVGKVAVPAEPTRGPEVGHAHSPSSPRLPARRSGPWIHVVMFLGFTLAVGAAVFFILARPSGVEERPGRPVGAVSVKVVPPVGVHVYVNDVLYDSFAAGEPIVVKDHLAGKHRIKVRGTVQGEEREAETTVEVIEGKTAPITVSLEGN